MSFHLGSWLGCRVQKNVSGKVREVWVPKCHGNTQLALSYLCQTPTQPTSPLSWVVTSLRLHEHHPRRDFKNLLHVRHPWVRIAEFISFSCTRFARTLGRRTGRIVIREPRGRGRPGAWGPNGDIHICVSKSI